MSDYPNSGSIRRNQFKKEGSKQPDGRGSCHITCPACLEESTFEISAWFRTGNNGAKFTNLKFTSEAEAAERKRAREEAKSGKPAPAPDDAPPGESDQVPF
jgi:hypothetical protein